jgi:hypothetical protein
MGHAKVCQENVDRVYGCHQDICRPDITMQHPEPVQVAQPCNHLLHDRQHHEQGQPTLPHATSTPRKSLKQSANRHTDTRRTQQLEVGLEA